MNENDTPNHITVDKLCNVMESVIDKGLSVESLLPDSLSLFIHYSIIQLSEPDLHIPCTCSTTLMYTNLVVNIFGLKLKPTKGAKNIEKDVF